MNSEIDKEIDSREEDVFKDDKLMRGVGIWVSYYRLFPHKFVEDYFGIFLKPFQKILIYFMIHFNHFMYLASRGQGKTFLTAIFCCCRAILYPESKIILASGNKSQAIETLEKILEMKSSSPLLFREIDEIKTGTNDARCTFKNGSWIRVVASNQGARSKRANLIVVDEFVQVDKLIIDSVLKKFMSAPRQPKYLQKKQYSHLKERNKEIYLSSCWFKFHWSWDKTKAFFNSMVDGKEYFICSLPYQLPIKENLLDRRQVEEEMSESDFNEILWLMEMEAQFYGESDKAYFKFKDLEVNRTLSIPIYPKPFYDIFKDNKFKYVKKGHDEIRIVSCDIAMMSGKKNDASIYTIMRLIPMKNKVGKYYSREIVYIESMEGGHSTAQATRIRQLVDDFECDYICIDCQGVGMGVYDVLVQPIYDKERMKEYEPWTAFNNKEMEERCAYPDAPKRIFAMKAYGEINSECAISFKDNLSKGKIKLLINENDCKEVLKKIKGYGTLDIEEKVQLELPYRQTTSLISEMVNLEVDIHPQTRQIKLKEQSGKRKDRWSSASYGNYLANILEKDLVKVSDYDVNRNYVFV